MTSLPAPIAVALSEYEDENQPFRKLHRVVDVYEALLKYATVLAIQNFYAAQLAGGFPEVDRQIRDRITQPSLGHWREFLREVLLCFAEREGSLFYRDLFLFHFRSFGKNPRPQKSFASQGAAEKLLNLRNIWSHGATLPDDEAAARVKEHEKDLQRLLDEAAFFAKLPLFYVEAQAGPGEFIVQPLMGAKYPYETPISFSAAIRPVGHVVVVDGLDEAARGSTKGRGVETGQTLVDWLPDAASLPEGVNLIVSTRPELLEHPAFATKFGRDKAEWLALSKLTDTDIRALLYQVRSKYEVLDAGEYVDAIVQRSEGSPLYLRMLLEDLEEGRLTLGQVDELPRGVIAYFARILEFIEGEGRTREMSDLEPLLRAKQETLEALMAQGILTQEQADAQLERERAALEGRAGVKSVDLLALYCLVKEPFLLSDAATVLRADLVEAQRAFDIIRTVLVNDGKARFAVFHTAFRDYFRNLGNYTETKLHRHADTIACIRDRLLSYCARWQEYKEPYALRHYAEHLRESKRWTELFALVRNAAFRQAQVQVFSDDPDLPLRTIRTALLGAAEAGDAAAMAEFLLAHVQLLGATRQETPLDALRAGQLERAWQLTDLYEGNLCILWHLLLAWESGERGRIEEMQGTLERLRARKISLGGGSTWASELACLFVPLLDIDQMTVSTLWGRLLADSSAREQCARALVDRGCFSAACELAQEITEAGLQEKLLHDIVIAQVRTGQIPAACETAQKIKQTEWRARALVSVAGAQAQSGDGKAARETCITALRTVQEVEQNEGRGKILRDIAVIQMVAGQKKRARETLAEALRSAQKIEKAEQRAEVLEAVATAQEKIGVREEVRKTLALAVEAAQAASHDPFSYPKVTWLTSIATTQWQVGDKEAARKLFADAVEIAQAQGDTMRGGDALADIAAAQAEVGEFTAALETARKIENTDRQAIALAYIAREQAHLGNKEEAQSLLIAALETTQEGLGGGAEIMGLIAVSLARAGEFTLAYETLKHADFDDEESREEIYENVYGEIGIIGIRQVRSGQMEAAWKRVFEERETQIEKWIRNGHNLYLLDITAAFAEAEDYRIFKRLLIACAYFPRAAYRMCGLLLQIYPEQVEAVAAVVMWER